MRGFLLSEKPFNLLFFDFSTKYFIFKGGHKISNLARGYTMAHDHEEISTHTHQSHEASLWSELGCHFPWATFSVAIGFIILGFVSFVGMLLPVKQSLYGYHMLFHAFHYLHIIYAVVGTMLAYVRFSRTLSKGLILSIISPMVFCTISDIIVPTLAGNFLGIPITIHICFYSELHNIVPLLFLGLVTGYILSKHQESSLSISIGSHFAHILLGSLAALFYMASYGFTQWYESMGILFVFLVIGVVVPCTLSDIVVPWYFAQRRYEKHTS